MRRVLIFLLALLAAGATLFLLQMRNEQIGGDPKAAEPPKDAVYVLVFARDMRRGTLLDEAGVRWQQQLRAAIGTDTLVTEAEGAPLPTEIDGKLLRGDVLAGEAVRPSYLLDGSASFMSLTLTPGMRAVGIAVTPQKLAGGFILPEDRVDLIQTIVADLDGDGKQSGYSQTVLENIRVLAVGDKPTSRVTFQTAEQQDATTDLPPSDVTMKGETITLEMSDAEAAVLFSAMASGQISLALRAIEDQGPSRIGATFGLETPPAPPEPEEPVAVAPVVAPQPAPDQPVVVQPAPKQPTTRNVRVVVGGVASVIEVPIAKTSGSN